MSDQTTLEVVLSSESTVGNPIIETVTVLGTVPIGPRGIDGSGSGLVDGDYGDVTVSGTGTVMTIDNGAVTAAKVAADVATQAELDAEAALARNADNLTSGTVADARIASTIARDSEVSAAVASEATARDAAIATASTADRARANHTGTQLAATISDLTETVQDLVGAMATDGTTVNFTYDDTAGTLTAEVQGLTSSNLSDFAEAVRDRLGSTLVAGTGITVTVDDPGDTVTIATTITQYTDEMARDAIGAALVAGTNITITPDDVANTITIDATGGSSYTDENAQDAVGTILADSATIDFTYTDATPEITAAVKDGSITAAKVAADVATQAELDAVAGTIPNTEAIQDVVGGMVSGGTETGIAVSYDDTNGRLDFVAEVTQVELDAKADDSAVVHDTGDETVAGVKTFSSDPIIPDEAYDATAWNGVLEPPTKNAVRDKIEDILDGVTFSGDVSVPDEAYDATNWNGSLEVPTKNAVRDKIETLGGGAAPVMVTGIGAGGGDNSISSSTFGDIAAALTCSVPAVAGDRLLMTFECQHYHSAGAGALRIKFAVAGTLVSGMPTTGLFTLSGSSDSRFDVFSWPYTVQAGDISGGNVSVKPQFATPTGTVSVRNDGSLGLPFMRVINMRQ